MSRLLLSRPLVFWLSDQHLARYAAQHLFQPRRSASKTDANVGVLLHWKREVEFAFKPDWDLAHRALRFNFDPFEMARSRSSCGRGAYPGKDICDHLRRDVS